jgi:hypothetical protein
VLQATLLDKGIAREVHAYSSDTIETMNAIHGLPMPSTTNPFHEDAHAQHAAIVVSSEQKN